MLIKRITLFIYFFFLFIGVLLFSFTDFKYSMDIIISSFIPISILLPDVLLYKKNVLNVFYNSLVSLMNECTMSCSTILFCKDNLDNLPEESLGKHLITVENSISFINNTDSHIFLFKNDKLILFSKEINMKVQSLKVSLSSLQYCISKYRLDTLNINIDHSKYQNELFRQLDIIEDLFNDLKSILDKYSDIFFNSSQKDNWKLQKEMISNVIAQENMRSKI